MLWSPVTVVCSDTQLYLLCHHGSAQRGKTWCMILIQQLGNKPRWTEAVMLAHDNACVVSILFPALTLLTLLFHYQELSKHLTFIGGWSVISFWPRITNLCKFCFLLSEQYIILRSWTQQASTHRKFSGSRGVALIFSYKLLCCPRSAALASCRIQNEI